MAMARPARPDQSEAMTFTAFHACPTCGNEIEGYTLDERYDKETINRGRRVGPARLKPCGHVAWVFAADDATTPLYMRWEEPWYLIVCRDCGEGDDALVMPFDTAGARGKWAAEHKSGTGHDRWIVTEEPRSS